MHPRIETIPEKKLVGKSLKMTISGDRTFELWNSFMPARKQIRNQVGTDLFSMQVYNHSLDFKNFNQDTEFEKWAAAEVSDFADIPGSLQTYTLKGGLYAVFIYKGLPGAFRETFEFIFYSWLPASEYEVDKREHFEILGDLYKYNDPASEEEIWIPVKLKT